MHLALSSALFYIARRTSLVFTETITLHHSFGFNPVAASEVHGALTLRRIRKLACPDNLYVSTQAGDYIFLPLTHLLNLLAAHK